MASDKINNSWLPKLIECEYFSKYREYEDMIYGIFINDFVNQKNVFLGKRLEVTKKPLLNNKIDGFNHLVFGHERKSPDFDRCARVKWPKVIIDEINNNGQHKSEIKIYYKEGAYHLLLEKERYIVVIKDKGDYMLLITGFYINGDRYLRSKLKDYERYKVDV